MIRTSKQTTDSTPIDLLQWTVRMTKKLRFGQDWGWRFSCMIGGGWGGPIGLCAECYFLSPFRFDVSLVDFKYIYISKCLIFN